MTPRCTIFVTLRTLDILCKQEYNVCMDMGYTQVISHEKAMNMIFNYGILKYVKR